MKKINLFLMMCLLLTGCASNRFGAYVGVSIDPTMDGGQPEIDMPNPLGVARVEYRDRNNKNRVFCEHVSSLTIDEHGYGFNHCGLLFGFK